LLSRPFIAPPRPVERAAGAFSDKRLTNDERQR
jgi:hypothetical protein